VVEDEERKRGEGGRGRRGIEGRREVVGVVRGWIAVEME
jgi:hypothetical protein